MDTKHTIPISEARKRIFEIAEEVQAPSRTYTLTADGKPKAVILSAKEYESILETLDVLEENPDLPRLMKQTDAAFKTGEWKKWPTLDGLRSDWGFARGVAVAEKSKKKYVVSSRTSSKRTKRAR